MRRPAWIALAVTAAALAGAAPASARPSKALPEVASSTPAASSEGVSSAPTAPSAASPETVSSGRCSPGAHTLSCYGERVYPETGNGGYTSVHTEVDLSYSAATNRFLPGNHVALTRPRTQCLSSLTLDFEPSALGSDHRNSRSCR